MIIAQEIFALNVAKLIMFIFENGYACTLGEAYRTKEQAEIYAKQGKGINNSQHCKRLAIDLNLFTHDGKYLNNSEDYELIGAYWENLHDANRWGGNFQRADGSHFEMKEES